MNRITILCFILLSQSAFGQDNPTEQAKPIVDEGKRLYRSEMASWYGTDLFLENHKDRSNIGGYFSYADNGVAKCVFFSNADNPKVIGTISFDSTYDTKTAKIELAERGFTNNETALYTIRKLALARINSDTLFKTYKNTSLNLIPLINAGEKKVYVLTGSDQSGLVIFGNDYLMTFDKDNNLISTRQLHQNLIPIKYNNKEGNEKEEGAIHSHLPETGDFITATDICTLMLYEKFTTWKQHSVMSNKYLNIWNCQTDQLTVIPMETIKKMNKDQEKKKNNDKNE